MKRSYERKISKYFRKQDLGVVDLRDNKTIVSCKWAFKLKPLADGLIKYKARLVARGITIIPCVGNFEIFSLGTQRQTICFLFEIAAKFKL